ncbi:BON domain-containing protein [Agrobacterium rhizogenes]|nr:BON domain-containing protein [Rhizobium rhizogenes]NTH62100.1 BON domain-containing protein [Rhizobium rhizogenes]NTH93726.1 BON domain-containing protein [Rhizobium rhizogenes]
MTEIKDTKTAAPPAEPGDIRTLQALDQAAGGSGNVSMDTTTQASATQDVRPQPDTDDARCEDSEERDRRRKQDVDEVSSRMAEIRKTIQSKGYDDDIPSSQAVAAEGGTLQDSARTQVRSDTDIRTEIESRLKADRLLNAAGIFVSVSHGRVIIEGSVENDEAMHRAETISRQVSGITGHDSNLAVRKPR